MDPPLREYFIMMLLSIQEVYEYENYIYIYILTIVQMKYQHVLPINVRIYSI